MWMVDPKGLCNKHLLGEHGEIHKHRHNFVKGHSVKGRLNPVVQIEPSSMQTRHDELAKEMLRRGMNHKSPYEQPDLSNYDDDVINARVDLSVSLKDLHQRCESCKNLSTE
jgi:hypothetical protein